MTNTRDDGAAAGDDGAATSRALAVLRDLAVALVGRCHRLDVTVPEQAIDRPVLFVANHGFGGIFDLNNVGVLAALARLDVDRPVTILAHQLTWTLGVGPLLEPLGLRPAGRESAEVAFALGHHLRIKALPVSVSVPWGLSVGAVGILPYLPLPTKLRTAVLEPITPHADEPAESFGDRVEDAMQAALTKLTANRKLLLG